MIYSYVHVDLVNSMQHVQLGCKQARLLNYVQIKTR